MNTTEPGPSETKQMIAINESLRAELARANGRIEAQAKAICMASDKLMEAKAELAHVKKRLEEYERTQNT